MQVRAEAKFLPISPRKVRPIAAAVVKKPVNEALTLLSYMPKKGAFILRKVINSARANAVNNHHLLEENLFLKKVVVNEGPRLKRMDKSHSARFHRGIIQKRRAHILVVLETEEKKEKKAKPTTAVKLKTKTSRKKKN